MTDTAFAALTSLIANSESLPEDISAALATARADVEEFGLSVPDAATGQLLATLAAATKGTKSMGAVAITPAASVVGLYLLNGLGASGSLTCIDPEVEHQNQAKAAFKAAGYSTSRVRFLPSRPLDVMRRLAAHSYQLVYADVDPTELKSMVDAGLRLLIPGGTLVLADALLDATIADLSRNDRGTLAAREANDYIDSLEEVVVARLPLGAGYTLITAR